MSATFGLDITGMSCAACAGRVERALGRLEGVRAARVNLALERAEVEVEGALPPDALVEAVRATGYGASLRSSRAAERRAAEERLAAGRRADARATLARFAVCAAFTLALLVGTLPMMTGGGHAWIGPWAQLALSLPVMIVGGSRFAGEAAQALRAGSANMAVLVSLGTGAAFLYSAWRVLDRAGHDAHLYFEAACVVVTLVLLGKYLEARAKGGASAALHALTRLQPDTAERIGTDGVQTVPVDALRPGDRILVRPGARVPADGLVAEGRSSVDEALLTGESRAVEKLPGVPVVTGTTNGSGALEIVVTAIGEDTRLAQIARLVEAAQNGTAPIQRLVDRVSAIFVPAILALAALTFLGWLLAGGGFEPAFAASIAVLVIACPCALGLATPTALVAGTGAAARAGVLIRDIETLERAHGVDIVLFDKTGTLTEGRPAVTLLKPAPGVTEGELMRVAASAEARSEHPLARAVVRLARERGIDVAPAEAVRAEGGRGLTARVDGAEVAIGNAAMMREAGVDASAFEDGANSALTLAYVGREGRLLGAIGFSERARPEAAAAIATLRAQGLRTGMLTGDLEPVARAVAAEIGLDQVEARLSPEEKLTAIERLRGEGARVAFVGDGLNDGPALAAADLGIAMLGGTDVAKGAAAITLMRPDLRLVPAALAVAARTRATIRQNLIWAFLYNLVGVPLAAFGLLSPAFAGAAMALSSVSVVANAAWLARWRPSPHTPPESEAAGRSGWSGLPSSERGRPA